MLEDALPHPPYAFRRPRAFLFGDAAAAFGEELGVKLWIDNRPDAGGVIGARHAAHSVPDGRTFGLAKKGAEPRPETPEEFARFIAAKRPKWARLVRALAADRAV
ncbi:tripartite tricarboxylate transporter substrate-binding protein [Sutterella sp.]|uniref:tripartite tricarboxylate transporter substrate-binding protein n=1 Tax=Sutterella sp. TaxID=1981025 RepID=UPI003FD7F639